MTRKSAIQMLVAMLTGMVSRADGQKATFSIRDASSSLFEIHYGEPERSKEQADADYKACLAEVDKLNQDGSRLTVGCLRPDEYSAKLKPGTARMVVHLDGWKEFEVTYGGESIKISRQEIWDALRGGPQWTR